MENNDVILKNEINIAILYNKLLDLEREILAIKSILQNKNENINAKTVSFPSPANVVSDEFKFPSQTPMSRL